MASDMTSRDQPENEDEDVPEDFFDDFLKEDFMAGLDIVDEDNDVDGKSEKKNQSKSKVTKEERKRTNKLQKKMSKTSRDAELKKLDRELDEIRKALKKKSEKTVKSGPDADNFDIRRDPEKTRQAIQRDKIKSAKDKEKKLITDIVQTGLVPPGMELEIDIKEVGLGKSDSRRHTSDLNNTLQTVQSKSIDDMNNSARKHCFSQRPPDLKRRRSRTPKNNRSQERKYTRDKTRSPVRSRIPQHSPARHRSPITRRNPIMHQNFQLSEQQRPYSPVRRNLKSPIRRRSKSPISRRSRSRSVTKRNPLYRSDSRDHSLSYRRRRDKSYSPLGRLHRRRTHSRTPKKAKEEKVSFLEELVAKLNETHPVQPSLPSIPTSVTYLNPNIAGPVVPPIVHQQLTPTNYFVPTSVSQPQTDATNSQIYDPYDESFFIGSTASFSISNQRQFKEENTPFTSNSVKASQADCFQRYDGDSNSDKEIGKLFGDKKIKLSDFLAITAKPQANNDSTAKLQEKVRVLQRCQDAIKILNERKFTGPLLVLKMESNTYSKDPTLSPLLRKPIVQLPYTTPGMRHSNQMDFTKSCETLLYRIGIEKKLSWNKAELDIATPKELHQKEVSSLLSTQVVEPPISSKVVTKSLSTQTDKDLSSCKECLHRKGILYANCGIQAGNPMVTFSVSTQVTEADFYSMIPKTQSLASLTPAQLLGKQSMIVCRNSNSQEHLSRPRQIPSPPAPPSTFFAPHQTAPLRPPLFSQTVLPPLMQQRSLLPNNTFNEDRRSGFNKRF